MGRLTRSKLIVAAGSLVIGIGATIPHAVRATEVSAVVQTSTCPTQEVISVRDSAKADSKSAKICGLKTGTGVRIDEVKAGIRYSSSRLYRQPGQEYPSGNYFVISGAELLKASFNNSSGYSDQRLRVDVFSSAGKCHSPIPTWFEVSQNGLYYPVID